MSAAPAIQAFDAFEAMLDPAAILAEDGSLLRANSAFRAVFRHWIGPSRPPWGRINPPPFDLDRTRRFEAAAPDGRRFEWAERELPDRARLAVARDITKHVSAAEEAMRAKTVLFATLTHELRTPLNGVLGMAGLLEQTKLEPAQQSYVAAIRQSGELLLDLITDILDYSQIEAGRVTLEMAEFDPESSMQDVAELLSPKAYAKGLEIAACVRRGAPNRIIGDEGRLKQILFNLAGNSVKFTEEGGVLLECAQRPNGLFRFSVRDTGPGVPPDKQAFIFEEFAQAEAGVARRHGGAGLGLAIVRKLAHAMGGEAGLVSAPGQGAEFWVELPFETVGEAKCAASLSGVRAAIRTETPILARAIGANLMSLGASVVGVEENPDVILVDWRKPLSQHEADQLKTSARALVALAPQEQREAIAECRAIGIAHYALKPARRRSLAERIRASLGDAEAAPEETGLPQGLHGKRVLLAEDNPINALLARTLLTRAGCVVDTAQDGEEAVAAAEAAPYDLILLDIRMPRLDGLGAARLIRALPAPASRTPIIALTADSGEDERARALAAGMDAFLTKPIDSARLYKLAARFTAAAKPASLPDA